MQISCSLCEFHRQNEHQYNYRRFGPNGTHDTDLLRSLDLTVPDILKYPDWQLGLWGLEVGHRRLERQDEWGLGRCAPMFQR